MAYLDTIDSFVTTALETYRSSARTTAQLFIDFFKNISDSANDYSDKLKKLPSGNNAGADADACLLELLSSLKAHINGLEDIHSGITVAVTGHIPADSLEELLKEYAERITLPVPSDFWNRDKNDSSAIIAAKYIGKQWKVFVRFLTEKRNAIAAGFGGKPVVLKRDVRSFSQHDFFRYFFVLPVLKAHIIEIQNILKVSADSIYLLHSAVDKICCAMLFEKREGDSDSADADIEAAGSLSAAINRAIESLEEMLQESESRFSRALESIHDAYLLKWTEAGTFVLPARSFSALSFQTGVRALSSEAGKNAGLWNVHFRGEEDDWLSDIELTMLSLNAGLAGLRTFATIRDSIVETIMSAFDRADLAVAETIEHLEENQSDEDGYRLHLESTGDDLNRRLRETLLPQIMDAVVQTDLNGIYKKYLLEIQSTFENVSNAHGIFEYRDNSNIPPASKISRIALKELVYSEAFEPLKKIHEESAGAISSAIEQHLRSVSELDQIVEYTLHASMGLITGKQTENAVAEAYSTAIDGLERMRNQIKELKTAFDEITALTADQLSSLTTSFNGTIQDMMINDKVIALKLRLARAKTRHEIRVRLNNAWNVTKQVFLNALPRLIAFAGRIRTEYRKVRKATGLVPGESSIDARLTAFLGESQVKMSHLPYIYQRLFSLEPLTDRRFFSSRDDEMASIQKAFSSWHTGKPSALLLTGERGSGKTSLLYFANADIFKDYPVKAIELKEMAASEEALVALLQPVFNLPQVHTIEELADEIVSKGERMVCVFENLHFLFVRTIDGFTTLEHFMLLIRRTEHIVFWTVTCALYSWRYLDKVVHISRSFGTTVELGLETREEVEDTIIKRHRVSGYLLDFEVPADVEKNRKYTKIQSAEARRAFVRERFFDQIARQASGNIRVAILLWLMAIRDVTKDRMMIGIPAEFDHSFVYRLPPEELFTLAALIQHEYLNPATHALVFNQDARESEILLNMMNRKGYLSEKDGKYSIHPLVYRPVVKALQSKNILQ